MLHRNRECFRSVILFVRGLEPEKKLQGCYVRTPEDA